MKFPLPLRYSIPGALLLLGLALTAISLLHEDWEGELLTGNLNLAWLMGGVALLSTLLMWWYFERTFRQRARRLEVAAMQLAAGDYEVRAGLKGADELASLGVALDQLAEALEEKETAEREARESAELFRTLVDRVTDAIEIIEPETGRILDMNERGCLDLGYTLEEVRLLRLPDINPLITPDAFQRLLDILRKSGTLNIESVHRRKDGTTFPIEKSLARVSAGGEDYLVSIVRDITARKLSEHAQRSIKSERAAIVDSAMDGIICLEADGSIRSMNPAAEGIFGCRSAQVVGYPLQPAIHPAGTLERLIASLMPSTHGSTVPARDCRVEVTGIRADRTEVPLELSLIRMPGSGEPVFTAFIRDISRRRQAQQEAAQHLALICASLDSLREAVIISDLQGNLYHWNRAALDMHGYASLEECRRNVKDFASEYEFRDPDGSPIPMEQWPLLRVLRGEVLQELHLTIHHRIAGWERQCSYSGKIARNAAGEALLAVLTVTDITAKMQSVMLRGARTIPGGAVLRSGG